MTERRKKAFENAVASARIEGLTLSEQSRKACLQYLEGKIDTATLVKEALNRQRAKETLWR